MEILQGVWKQHLRPRAVVGYGVKMFLPSPPNYVTRSPGTLFSEIPPGWDPVFFLGWGARLRKDLNVVSILCECLCAESYLF